MEKLSRSFKGRGDVSFSSATANDTFYEEDDNKNEEIKITLVVEHDANSLFDSNSSHPGSSVVGAALNFTNSIVGAGCIGYGGAMADSGGLISILINVAFAVLSKFSFDLLIDLGVHFNASSYEELGSRAFGATGRMAVIWSKVVFAFGGMVAFMVVARDNFSPALVSLLGLDADPTNADGRLGILDDMLSDKNYMTAVLCTCVILPLSLMRDVSFLERFSGAKIAIFAGIVATVVYFYFYLPPTVESNSLTFREKWLEVRPGVIKSTGTFVYGYVSQHTVHMVFRSLKQPVRNMDGFREVSTISVGLALSIFLCLSVFAYMTFYDRTSSDLFDQYPALPLVDWARILLSIAMLFTYPMNLFSLREMFVQCFPVASAKLYLPIDHRPTEHDRLISRVSDSSDFSDAEKSHVPQSTVHLSWSLHVGLTVLLWGSSLAIALTPASLGDVLNLIGCIAGALIAFILPALFASQLHGYNTLMNSLLFLTGCFVGCFGTYFGIKDMISKSTSQ